MNAIMNGVLKYPTEQVAPYGHPVTEKVEMSPFFQSVCQRKSLARWSYTYQSMCNENY